MIPKTYNFKEQYAGDTFNGVEIAMTDGDNLPIDISTAIIKMQIKTAPFGSIVKDLSIGNGITIMNANTFRIDPFINPTKAFRYYYDIQIDFQNGVVKTYLKGSYTIVEDITR